MIQVISDRARRIPKDLSWEQAKDYELWRPHLEAARQILQAPGAASTDPQGVSHHKQLVNFIDGGVFRLSNPVLFERTFAQASKLYDEAKAAAQGKTQQARQKFAAAVESYRNVIDQARIAFPADSLQLAGYLHRLAELFEELGRYRDGIPLAEESVYIARTQANLPKLATYLNHLAVLYNHQGRYSEAEPLYQQALAMNQRLLGEEQPETQRVWSNLKALLRRLIAANRTTELSDHPITQQLLTQLQEQQS